MLGSELDAFTHLESKSIYRRHDGHDYIGTMMVMTIAGLLKAMVSSASPIPFPLAFQVLNSCDGDADGDKMMMHVQVV